jgi:hypothetical protein
VAVLWTALPRHLTRHPLTRMEEQALYGAELVWNRPTACLAFRSVSMGGLHSNVVTLQGLHTGALLLLLQEEVQAGTIDIFVNCNWVVARWQ